MKAFVVGGRFLMMMFFTTTSLAAVSEIRPVVSLGSGVLFERANDNLAESSRMPISFGAGARWQQWSSRLEYARFQTVDGNDMISVSRELETLLLWTAYDFGSVKGWTPYVAIALGATRTEVETRLVANRETVKGSFDGMFALGGGFRAQWTSNFAIRPELRYESAGSFKTKDARMGAFVSADILF